MMAGGLYGYSGGKRSLPWYCPSSYTLSFGPVITKCHSRMLLGLRLGVAAGGGQGQWLGWYAHLDSRLHHPTPWAHAPHLGSATTFGTGSLPSRWYSFCSRETQALDAPPMTTHRARRPPAQQECTEPSHHLRQLSCTLATASVAALALLLHGSGVWPGAALITSARPAVHDVAAQRREVQGRRMLGRDVVACIERLSLADEPWFAVYGDSLTRGVFFDVATLLNSSAGVGSDVVHPGHGANYSDDCTIFETRPPLRRLKCGGFEYATPLTQDDSHRTGRVVTPQRLAGTGLGRTRQLHMTFRLKTFTWEEEFDTPWLESLRHAPRLPDVLLLGFGVWDMQYPPSGDVAAGIEVLLLRALEALEAPSP